LSEVDVCPVCGEPVKRKNLVRHYGKVHPKRASTLFRPIAATESPKTRRIRRPRRILLYALIGIAVVLVSVAAAEVVNVNTIRMHIHPQLSILIRGASVTLPPGIGIEGGLRRDRSLDRYGGVAPDLGEVVVDGTLHIEPRQPRRAAAPELHPSPKAASK